MMRLNPAYLKSYTPEAIDAMEWVSLESTMALWSPHFHVAIASVLAAEHGVCARVLEPLPPVVWPECFAKIAATFFLFADGVAAAAREPQRPFKLLDMLDAVVRERDRLDALCSSECAVLSAICERAQAWRAAAAGFFAFVLRIETRYVAGAAPGTCPRSCGTPAVAKAMRGAYAGFLKANDRALAGGRREVLPLDVIEGMVGPVFDEMGERKPGRLGPGEEQPEPAGVEGQQQSGGLWQLKRQTWLSQHGPTGQDPTWRSNRSKPGIKPEGGKLDRYH